MQFVYSPKGCRSILQILMLQSAILIYFMQIAIIHNKMFLILHLKKYNKYIPIIILKYECICFRKTTFFQSTNGTNSVGRRCRSRRPHNHLCPFGSTSAAINWFRYSRACCRKHSSSSPVIRRISCSGIFFRCMSGFCDGITITLIEIIPVCYKWTKFITFVLYSMLLLCTLILGV